MENNIFEKPKGLLNLGLTCYMNSLLQCLFYIKELREYYINNIKNFSANQPICKALAGVMDGLKNEKNDYFIPENFRNEIMKINDLFKKNKAGDIKDLFINLIDNLLEELKANDDSENENSEESENNEDDYSFNKEKQFQKTLKETDHNIINKIFGGYYLTTVKCEESNIKFYTIQNESFLLFDLKKIQEREKELTFDSCFDYYRKAKKSEFYCPKCKKVHLAEAKDSFYRPPKVLAIVLDRGKGKTFKGQFKFNSEILALNNYISENNYKYEDIYQLLGVASHSGSSSPSGHYTACCLADDGEYYYFSDSRVKKITLNELYENDPYLLFYIRTELKPDKNNIINKIVETNKGDTKLLKEITINKKEYETKNKIPKIKFKYNNKQEEFSSYLNFFIKNKQNEYSIDYYSNPADKNKDKGDALNPLIWKFRINLPKNNEIEDNNIKFKFDFSKNYENDLTKMTTLETPISHLNFENNSLLFTYKYKKDRNTLENIYIYIRFLYNLVINPNEKLFEKYYKNKKKAYNELEKEKQRKIILFQN